MKHCRLCGVEKPLSDFYLRRGRPDTRCKRCVAAYNKDRRADQNEARRRRSRVLKAGGICVRCGKNPTNPATSAHTCDSCIEYARQANARYRRKAKGALYELYGGRVCACCGETEELFLSLDHINEDSAKHRLSIGTKPNGAGFSDLVSLHRSLRQQGFPNVLQVLCHNCDFGKHLNGGICPHQERRQQ